jgi:hypothetical protein
MVRRGPLGLRPGYLAQSLERLRPRRTVSAIRGRGSGSKLHARASSRCSGCRRLSASTGAESGRRVGADSMNFPSNLLLAAVAFAPNLATAIALLLARFALSQMDVPTRQAYFVAVVDPSERTAAAAYTNTARTLTRPAAPLRAGAALRIASARPSSSPGRSRVPTTPASGCSSATFRFGRPPDHAALGRPRDRTGWVPQLGEGGFARPTTPWTYILGRALRRAPSLVLIV